MAKFKLFKNKKESGKEDMAMCSCGNMCKVSDIEAKKSAEVAQQQLTEESQHNSETSVQVLGSGCKKCNDLETATLSALTNLGMDTNIEHVTDFAQIASYGVMSTPALVVDGKVLSYGKLLKVEEIEALLKSARP
ncbi:MAG: hypothetical protein ATN31_06765 [Candidatus Epulonipiscioides saccharophilum]|nr:MAG: hypothetical protein ATN31_06765 [Epulopiscium sp. AS2M-Bin001]